jgi:hypothetical protein
MVRDLVPKGTTAHQQRLRRLFVLLVLAIAGLFVGMVGSEQAIALRLKRCAKALKL